MSEAAKFLLVFLGAGVGGCVRYAIGAMLAPRALVFPWATFGINLLGSLLIGVAYGLLERAGLGAWWRPLVIAGVLGGFTTFSSFSFETLYLVQSRHYGLAALYVLGSCGFGLLLCFAGYAALRPA